MEPSLAVLQHFVYAQLALISILLILPVIDAFTVMRIVQLAMAQVTSNVLPVIPITLKLTQPSTKASVSVPASRVMSIMSSSIYVCKRVKTQVLTL